MAQFVNANGCFRHESWHQLFFETSSFLHRQCRKRGKKLCINSGCGGQWYGSVGRAVASDTRGPQFESSRQWHFICNMYLHSSALERQKWRKKRQELPIFYIKKLKIKSQSLNVRKLALSEWRVGSKTFPLKYCAMLFLLAQPMFENSWKVGCRENKISLLHVWHWQIQFNASPGYYIME